MTLDTDKKQHRGLELLGFFFIRGFGSDENDIKFIFRKIFL